MNMKSISIRQAMLCHAVPTILICNLVLIAGTVTAAPQKSKKQSGKMPQPVIELTQTAIRLSFGNPAAAGRPVPLSTRRAVTGYVLPTRAHAAPINVGSETQNVVVQRGIGWRHGPPARQRRVLRRRSGRSAVANTHRHARCASRRAGRTCRRDPRRSRHRPGDAGSPAPRVGFRDGRAPVPRPRADPVGHTVLQSPSSHAPGAIFGTPLSAEIG